MILRFAQPELGKWHEGVQTDCPHCSSTNIARGYPEESNPHESSIRRCLDCGVVWVNMFDVGGPGWYLWYNPNQWRGGNPELEE